MKKTLRDRIASLAAMDVSALRKEHCKVFGKEPVNAHQKGYNQCPRRSVSAPAIEQAVIEQIRGIAANPGVVDRVVESLGEQRVADIETLEREKRLIERELERLGQELAGLVRTSGKLAVDRMAEVQERATLLERKLREVRDQLAEWVGQTVDVADVRRTLREFDRLWAEMTPREQEKFVKTLVEQVTYDGRSSEVTVGFRTAAIKQLCMEVTGKSWQRAIGSR
ncbi:MAG: hypothetical protein KatS3mg005_3585 [Bryobacteraceae bacterium]|nr:MAG: hypothetical protein KatS3mg005_3585 [Bryobacteraceae bacterium]